MAIASAVAVFVGFGRTYYLKSYFGTPQLSPLIHIHGAVFTLWMIFFVVQTALIASNRPGIHRRLGYAGAALAIAMVVLGTIAAFKARLLGHGAPSPDALFLVSLGDIFTFGVFVAAGFLWRRNREAHQRLMLLAVVAGLLSAAIPRIPDFRAHPPAMLFWAFHSSWPARFTTWSRGVASTRYTFGDVPLPSLRWLRFASRCRSRQPGTASPNGS